MRMLPCVALAGAIVTGPFRASAEDLLTLAEPQVVLEMAKGFGSAEIDSDGSGDPMIAGRIQGLKYVIYFYGCAKAKDCRSIQFSTGYDDAWTIEKANEFNKKFRWVKAFEAEGSNFKMDVDFKGGVSKRFLEEQFVTWNGFIEDMREAVK